MKKPRIPKYRKQKNGPGRYRAFIQIDGQRVYLGKYDSPESHTKYHRIIAEWSEAGYRLLLKADDDITIAELVARFWDHAKTHYHKDDGSISGELRNYRTCIRDLRTVYDDILVAEFSPKCLKVVRQLMIDRGLCRKNINSMVGRIKRIFKWGVENELVPVTVYRTLETVRNLQRNRSGAKESVPKQPVSQKHIIAVKPYVSSPVWAMIRFQLATGARPGEILAIRQCDIETANNDIWTYSPEKHKTEYKGFTRTIFINAHAQKVINPIMECKAKTDYIFSPTDAELEMREKRYQNRKTPLSCGNRQGTNRKDNRKVQWKQSPRRICPGLCRRPQTN